MGWGRDVGERGAGGVGEGKERERERECTSEKRELEKIPCVDVALYVRLRVLFMSCVYCSDAASVTNSNPSAPLLHYFVDHRLALRRSRPICVCVCVTLEQNTTLLKSLNLNGLNKLVYYFQQNLKFTREIL